MFPRHVYAAALIVGSVVTGTARAELAIESTSGDFLFFLDGDNVTRAKCTGSGVTYSRATCTLDVKHIPADIFFPLLGKIDSAELGVYQQRVLDAWAGIQQVEARLLELTHTTPDQPDSPVSWADVVAKRDELAAADLRVTEASDQLARIQGRLDQDDTDPDLLLQQEQWQVSRAQAAKVQTKLQQELATLTRRYVQDRVDQTDQDYRDLVAMHATYLTNHRDAQFRVGQEVEDVITSEIVARRLREQGFTWVSRRHDAMPGTTSILDAFSTAMRTTFSFSQRCVGEPNGCLVVDVPRRGRASGFRCFFNRQVIGDLMDCTTTLTNPAGVTAEFRSRTNYNLFLDTRENNDVLATFRSSGVATTTVEGPWYARFACSEAISSFSCEIYLQP